jgi:hypothetical protein
MIQSRGLSLARRQQILDRQDPPGWGAAYIPAILATREEAPSISRARQIWAPQLGRECHVISSVEARVATLALYHPALFELHEQRMLSIEPRPHPLANHPDYPGLTLSPMLGTLSVADRLDMLRVHPVVRFRDGDEHRIAPFPLIGDLLLFLVDDRGPYCVNWTVKATNDGFFEPIRTAFLPANPVKATADERARHAIEEIYYLDAGIRTQRITEAEIDDSLFHTLNHLLLWTKRKVSADEHTRDEILDRLRACLITQRPPLDEMVAMRSTYQLSIEELKTLFFQAIWYRELRVDLWSFISIDRPLKQETRDVLAVFARWFSRGDDHE